jgi:hypothetical protein
MMGYLHHFCLDFELGFGPVEMVEVANDSIRVPK